MNRLGSSPHSRGTQSEILNDFMDAGIIPAFAGNTTSAIGGFAAGGDHPRIRGEHPFKTPFSSSGLGSSPHSRGTLRYCRIKISFPGIIPAFAGNTTTLNNQNRAYKDHPRIRGEHHILRFLTSAQSGSSPHSRGTRLATQSPKAQPGIIPAFAGNTWR